jgi:hypothetical protein
MAKTNLIIKISIKHDTDKCKHQAINMLCDSLKEGLEIKGVNGNGNQYELKVTKVVETRVK